jgi:hypothetical protein
MKVFNTLTTVIRLLIGQVELSKQIASEATPNKLKHLDYLQAAIGRMAQNSFLFKGWAITLASGLSAFGVVQDKKALLSISIVTTVLFWGMDGYYLWLERGFVNIHKQVAKTNEHDVDFNMAVDKTHAFWRWLKTCFRPHLLFFYGTLLVVIIIGIAKLKGVK